jgi:hypothetical protein
VKVCLRLYIYITYYTILPNDSFCTICFLEIALQPFSQIILFLHPVYPNFLLDSAIHFQEYDMENEVQNESYSHLAYILSK